MNLIEVLSYNKTINMKVVKFTFLILLTYGCCYAKNETVDFPDKNLEKIVCDALNAKPPLTKIELRSLTHLEDYGGNISNLKGIEVAVNLKKLIISDNQIRDISPLSKLVNLQILGLWDNSIKDIKALRDLVKLSELILNDNEIYDISAISYLPNLKRLTLQRNPLNEEAYDTYIPNILKSNPDIVLYHDRTLTPERSLHLAKKYTLVVIVIFIAIICATMLFMKKKTSTDK